MTPDEHIARAEELAAISATNLDLAENAQNPSDMLIWLSATSAQATLAQVHISLAETKR